MGRLGNGQKFNIYFKNGLYRECYYTRKIGSGCSGGGFNFIRTVSDDYEIYDEITLNERVELIEENTIDEIEELDMCKFGHNNTISQQEAWFIEKINELVRGYNKLIREKQEKEK